ncbi:selenide, water dikinase SelD [Parabacteroides sp. FAFU027]|uniref:selenide, water dikinase SelD n=1 Tax=Parabacteroides sp. FAFU027 TaxID=2922715 RepID=UPI001FAF2E08|nr:selenide, water dikinase SelD [Parabacteroides sp. FAFU027]
MTTPSFDLLSTTQYGGCSAKLAPSALSELLANIPLVKDANILVDIETHDDAGVYKLNEETALIVTTDFFPPVCSDAFTFGQIAATNALSDVYAMGGTPLLALNLTMFPSQNIPLEVLGQILAGGQEKINESGALTMGGHTIDDNPPKYGLAVVGTVHPDRLITNAGLKAGQVLILTKPLGVGVLMAAQRMGMADEAAYTEALLQMKTLNKSGCTCMQQFGVKGATDVTGFGLLGHAMKMAEASGVTIQIALDKIPALPQAVSLLTDGCIPGAAFRNADYVKEHTFYAPTCSYERKMLACDAQTSGGLLMGVDADKAEAMLEALKQFHPQAAVIGEVIAKRGKWVYCI